MLSPAKHSTILINKVLIEKVNIGDLVNIITYKKKYSHRYVFNLKLVSFTKEFEKCSNHCIAQWFRAND